MKREVLSCIIAITLSLLSGPGVCQSPLPDFLAAGREEPAPGMSRKLVKISDDFLEPHRVRASILTAWRLNPVLRGSGLEVAVIERNLMLKGKTADIHEKNLAIRIASLLGTGLKLIDQISCPAGTVPALADSARIAPVSDLFGAVADSTATALAAKWIDSRKLADQVEADCADGVMTLSGHVADSALRRDIVRAISGLPGVNRVEENLQVEKLSWTDRLKNAVSRRKRTGGASSETATVARAAAEPASSDPAPGTAPEKNPAGGPEGSTDAPAVPFTAEASSAPAGDRNFKEKVTDGLKGAGEKASDVWITSKIKAAYAFNRHVNPMRIRVSTSEGVVTLSGRAMSRGEYEMAEKIAANVDGVVKIFNRIEKGWERDGD